MSDWGYCDWCGRKIPSSGGVNSGGLFVEHRYCSNQCKHEAEANEAKKRKEYDDDDDSQSLGFFGRLFRTIKRIFYTIVILFIVYVVYSYCKSKGLI